MNVIIFVYFFYYQALWLKEFRTFDDKSSTIKADTGVSSQLTEMILSGAALGRHWLLERGNTNQSLNQDW
ncbi:hypothetical protein BAE44_0017841, partial [Dichanthelium oligosanthes]